MKTDRAANLDQRYTVSFGPPYTVTPDPVPDAPRWIFDRDRAFSAGLALVGN